MIRRRSGAALLLVAAALVAAPGVAKADTDPAGCTEDLQYDPSIPTYNSVLGLPLGGGATGTTSRRLTADLQTYQHAVAVATQNNPRVRVIEKKMSDTALGRQVIYSVVGTPDNIDNLDAGRNDADVLVGVREGNISTDEGLRGRARPAGLRLGHRHAARQRAGRRRGDRCACSTSWRRALDCANAAPAAATSTSFIVPATQPGRPRPQPRAPTAWGFDPNRDRGTRVNRRTTAFTGGDRASTRACSSSTPTSSPTGTSSRPTRTPVHHEISQFALDFIQNDIGPMLQRHVQRPDARRTRTTTPTTCSPRVRRHASRRCSWARAGMTYEKGNERELRQAGLRPLPGDGHDGEHHVRPEGRASSPAGSSSGARRASRAPTASCSRTSWSARCTRRSSCSPTRQRVRLLLPARAEHAATRRG